MGCLASFDWKKVGKGTERRKLEERAEGSCGHQGRGDTAPAPPPTPAQGTGHLPKPKGHSGFPAALGHGYAQGAACNQPASVRAASYHNLGNTAPVGGGARD